MLTDLVGNDLSRLIRELEKLEISLADTQKRITAELVEKMWESAKIITISNC